jgi:cell division protein FtsZ
MIHFDLPKDQSSIIKVIGVGGGGSNAVNHMFSQNIEGVNFIICNTDAQAIAQSKVPNKIQLGPHLTQGLGAGANPSIGRQATEESLEEIKRILEVNTKMAFITAGMGGGTGTGGAPILAKICKDLGILTVGIVTTPFAYEGKKRIAQAEEGIMALKSHVDTLLVISNDKLRHQFGNLKMKEAFAKADNVLATAAKCITDVINSTGQINVDFADVCTVMSNGGVAILGSASAEGENRAQAAIENALNSPLLNDNDIRGAKWILININSAEGDHEFTMDEVEIIQNYLLSHAGEETDVILGLGYDSTLGSSIGITLIATGFEHKDPFPKATQKVEEVKNEKIVMTLNMPAKENKVKQATLQLEEKELYTDNPSPITDPSSPIPDNRSPITDPPSPTTDNRSLITDPSSPTTDNRSLITDNQSLITDHQSPTTDPTIEKQEEEKPFLPITYLTKPAQIYLHEEPLKNTGPVSESLPLPIDVQEDEPVMEMQLVVKDFPQQNEDNPLAVQTSQPASNSNEEAAVQDDTEELRRRATERIAKLRNLSFNTSAADHNNEFETVPAYLRRNMELHNSIANVESFYSSYTVKSDENNQAEISTINTFLEGKKPD